MKEVPPNTAADVTNSGQKELCQELRRALARPACAARTR